MKASGPPDDDTGPTFGAEPGYARVVRISIVTLFPEFFDSPLSVSIVGRAVDAGLVEIDIVDLRSHGLGPHRQVDDAPFGGGPGMVMMIGPLAAALDPFKSSHRVLLTPGGSRLSQDHLDRWADLEHLTLVCGRFEGVDERVAERLIDEQVSLGDFVIAGGEAVATAIVEGVARLLPGVVGNPKSIERESFREGLLEEPQYTRPSEFRGWTVPEILLSGDHARIGEWRRSQQLARTRQRRPDLFAEFVAASGDEYDPAAPDGRPRSSEGTPDEHA